MSKAIIVHEHLTSITYIFLPSPSKPYVTQHDEITALTFEQRHKFAIHFFAEINLEDKIVASQNNNMAMISYFKLKLDNFLSYTQSASI